MLQLVTIQYNTIKHFLVTGAIKQLRENSQQTEAPGKRRNQVAKGASKKWVLRRRLKVGRLGRVVE